MSQQRATQRRWMVQRTFEPDRLSATTLVQAYAHLVPYHIRVLRLPLASAAAEATQEPKQVHLSDRARSKITDLADPQRQDALVIEPITKKEAC
jgi:hypothetical protein